jgi:hypothetical protein
MLGNASSRSGDRSCLKTPSVAVVASIDVPWYPCARNSSKPRPRSVRAESGDVGTDASLRLRLVPLRIGDQTTLTFRRYQLDNIPTTGKVFAHDEFGASLRRRVATPESGV